MPGVGTFGLLCISGPFLCKMQLTYNIPSIFRNVFSPSLFTWGDAEWCLNSLPLYINAETCTYIELINYETGLKYSPSIPTSTYGWAKTTYNIPYIFERIKNGDTFVISNLSRYSKDINDICKSLETATGSAADAHLYGGLHTHSKSFNMHRDKPHNFIVQFDGMCEWRVWQDDVLVIHDTLYPGDAIYVPALFYHQAIPSGKRLSISFPFSSPHPIPSPDRNWYTLT